MKALANEIHLNLLDFLQGRKGFDHWWHNIDDETQAEIEEEMIDMIHSLLVEK